MKYIKENKAALILNAARILTVLFIIAAAVWYFASGHTFSAEAILSYTPQNWFLATLFMLLLYAVKSVVFFLPLMALQIAAGLFFPTWAAILVNVAGMSIELNLPYWIGRKLGFNSADKLFEKFPKLRSIIDGKGSKFFISYILRAINMLPFDLVSLYLGSIRFPFTAYFTGSLTGALFGILAATLIGTSLTNPTSPTFIVSCILSFTLAGASTLLYKRYSKKQAIK